MASPRRDAGFTFTRVTRPWVDQREVGDVAPGLARDCGLDEERLGEDPSHLGVEVGQQQASQLEAALVGHVTAGRGRPVQPRVVGLAVPPAEVPPRSDVAGARTSRAPAGVISISSLVTDRQVTLTDPTAPGLAPAEEMKPTVSPAVSPAVDPPPRMLMDAIARQVARARSAHSGSREASSLPVMASNGRSCSLAVPALDQQARPVEADETGAIHRSLLDANLPLTRHPPAPGPCLNQMPIQGQDATRLPKTRRSEGGLSGRA